VRTILGLYTLFLRALLFPFRGMRFSELHQRIYNLLRLNRAIPVRCGPHRFLVHARDMSSGYPLISRGRYRDDVLGPSVATALAKSAMICIDVGANIGYYTVILGKAAPPEAIVLAVEPDPVNFRYLKENMRLNGLGRVVPLHQCITDNGHSTILFRSDEHPGRNSLALKNVHKPTNAVLVSSTTIDHLTLQFCPRGPVFLKIDIEGAELLAMKGAYHTLALDCAILLEYWAAGIEASGSDPNDLLELLEFANFSPYLLDDKMRQIRRTAFEELRLLPKNRISNLLFLRSESAFDLATR
jgi:FkbM family methyltransferase